MTNLVVMRRGLFLASFPIFFITFSIPVQARQLGADALDIGLMFSVFTFSLLVMRPVVGAGLDRWGRKPFLVAAMLLYGICHLAYAGAESISSIYFARVIQGAGAALLLVTIDTLTADMTTGSERSTAMGRNLEIQTRGSIAGATVGFTFVGFQSVYVWELSFGFFALSALAAMAYLALRLEETRHQEIETTAFEISPALRKLLLVVIIASFASALTAPIYLIHLQDAWDIPLRYLSWAFLPAALVFAVMPSRMGRQATRFGTLPLLVGGLTLSATTYLLIAVRSELPAFVALYTLSAIGWAMSEPARKALVAEFAGVGAEGRSFGVTELYGGIGASIGPAIGGLVYDTWGAAATFGSTGGLLLMTALIAWVLLKDASGQPDED